MIEPAMQATVSGAEPEWTQPHSNTTASKSMEAFIAERCYSPDSGALLSI